MAKVGKTLTKLPRDGYIYAIKNYVWPEFIKIGRAVDVKKRLGTYNTGDPYRNYYVLHYVWTEDRFKAEMSMRKLLRGHHWSGEWYQVEEELVIRMMEAHCADAIVMPYLAR